MKKMLLFSFALAGFSIFAAPVNLIENPDFTAPDKEGGKCHGSWYGAKPAQFKEHYYHKIDKTESVKGGQSLKMKTDGPCIYAIQILKNLKPDTKYRFSVSIKLQDVKATQKGGGYFCQFFLAPGKKIPCPSPLLTGTLPWKKYTVEFTTPAKLCSAPYVELRTWEGTGTAWFDDVELTEVGK